MRTSTLVLLTLAALTQRAHADDADDDDDAMYLPVPRLSVAGGAQVHTTRVDGHAGGGTGLGLELAAGRGRWQVLVEGTLATAAVEDSTGRLLRGALGARWIARQFAWVSNAAVELFLLGGVGAQQLVLRGEPLDARLTRPEVQLGLGVQARMMRRPRFAIRIDLRALFTPSDSARTMETGASTGFITGAALVW